MNPIRLANLTEVSIKPCSIWQFLQYKTAKTGIRGALVAIYLISLLVSGGVAAEPVKGEDVCGMRLENQPGNSAYPYKITKNDSFISFIVIQEAAGKQVISIGGDFYKYEPQSRKLFHAEKLLKEKPKDIESAVRILFQMWANEHCDVR